MEWFGDTSTKIVALIGAVFGILGTCLAGWARWEQIRDARAKREKEKPQLEAEMGTERDGWRELTIRFRIRDGERFEVEKVSVGGKWRITQSAFRVEARESQPQQHRPASSFWQGRSVSQLRRPTFSVAYPNEETASASISVNWTLAKKDRSARLWIAAETASRSERTEPSIKLTCRSISARRERFTLNAIVKDMSATD